MPSTEEEMSLAVWHDLLGTELKIAFEELAEIRRSGGSERYERYVETCAEQCWALFARNAGQRQKMIVPNAADKIAFAAGPMEGKGLSAIQFDTCSQNLAAETPTNGMQGSANG